MIQRSYDYFSRFLPWLVIAPIYFAKEVDFGVFGQASIASVSYTHLTLPTKRIV